MGMFDSVWVKCPSCGNSVGFQSKAGDCVLADYDQSEVPAVIAADIDGTAHICQNCGHVVYVSSPVPTKVNLYVT